MSYIDKLTSLVQTMAADEKMQKIAMKHSWMSGCQTDVSPLELWTCGIFKRIEIQLDVKRKKIKSKKSLEFYKADERRINEIASKYLKEYPKLINTFTLCVKDDSCPPVLVFWLYDEES